MEAQIIKPFENESYNDYILRIQNSRNNVKDENNYQEEHHIIPKCMGGSNSKDNLIYLYAQEHYWAHQILAKENPENSGLQIAYWAMSGLLGEKRKNNIIINEEDLVDAREKMAKSKIGLPKSEETLRLISEHHADVSGEKNPMYGKHHSEETREKLRRANIGKTMTEEQKQKISNSLKGREVSEKTKETARKRFSSLTGENHLQAKKVKCLNTGDIFGCAMDAGIWAGLGGKNPGTSIIKSIRHPDKINYAGHVPAMGEPAHWKYIEE